MSTCYLGRVRRPPPPGYFSSGAQAATPSTPFSPEFPIPPRPPHAQRLLRLQQRQFQRRQRPFQTFLSSEQSSLPFDDLDSHDLDLGVGSLDSPTELIFPNSNSFDLPIPIHPPPRPPPSTTKRFSTDDFDEFVSGDTTGSSGVGGAFFGIGHLEPEDEEDSEPERDRDRDRGRSVAVRVVPDLGQLSQMEMSVAPVPSVPVPVPPTPMVVAAAAALEAAEAEAEAEAVAPSVASPVARSVGVGAGAGAGPGAAVRPVRRRDGDMRRGSFQKQLIDLRSQQGGRFASDPNCYNTSMFLLLNGVYPTHPPLRYRGSSFRPRVVAFTILPTTTTEDDDCDSDCDCDSTSSDSALCCSTPDHDPDPDPTSGFFGSISLRRRVIRIQILEPMFGFLRERAPSRPSEYNYSRLRFFRDEVETPCMRHPSRGTTRRKKDRAIVPSTNYVNRIVVRFRKIESGMKAISLSMLQRKLKLRAHVEKDGVIQPFLKRVYLQGEELLTTAEEKRRGIRQEDWNMETIRSLDLPLLTPNFIKNGDDCDMAVSFAFVVPIELSSKSNDGGMTILTLSWEGVDVYETIPIRVMSRLPGPRISRGVPFPLKFRPSRLLAAYQFREECGEAPDDWVIRWTEDEISEREDLRVIAENYRLEKRIDAEPFSWPWDENFPRLWGLDLVTTPHGFFRSEISLGNKVDSILKSTGKTRTVDIPFNVPFPTTRDLKRKFYFAVRDAITISMLEYPYALTSYHRIELSFSDGRAWLTWYTSNKAKVANRLFALSRKETKNVGGCRRRRLSSMLIRQEKEQMVFNEVLNGETRQYRLGKIVEGQYEWERLVGDPRRASRAFGDEGPPHKRQKRY